MAMSLDQRWSLRLANKWPTVDAERRGYTTKWDYLDEDERRAANAQSCTNSEGKYLRCGGCGTPHHTEGDFARHYRLVDIRWLNLGNCPTGG
jgi:hypothetical protein